MSSYIQSKRYQTCQRIFDRTYPNFRDAGTQYAEHVTAQVDSHTLLLDVGCGRDSLAGEPLKIAGYSTGIDLVMSDLRSNHLLHSTTMANAEHIPFPDATFDVIVSQWVVEHFTNPEAAFVEMARVLKPGGALIFMTTNAHNYVPLLSRLIPDALQKTIIERVLKRPSHESFPTYFRANTHQRITALGASSGLDIEHFAFVGNPFYLAFNVFAFRLGMLFERITDAPRLRWLKLYIVVTLRKTSTE